jgi:hypothetical protein
MTVPPSGPDATSEPDDVEDLVPDGDRAAQIEPAWPDDDDDVNDEVVPDPDRVVVDTED